MDKPAKKSTKPSNVQENSAPPLRRTDGGSGPSNDASAPLVITAPIPADAAPDPAAPAKKLPKKIAKPATSPDNPDPDKTPQ